MNEIDRKLVKSQARQLIKSKVFSLFLMCLIVTLLTGATLGVNTSVSNFKNQLDEFNSEENLFDEYDDYDSYGSQTNPFENFEFESKGNGEAKILPAAETQSIDVQSNKLNFAANGILGISSSLVAFIFTPLSITLAGFFVVFIKRRSDEELNLGKEIGALFTKTFDSSYLNKLLVTILVGLFTMLWSLLFIIPGIVFMYSAYFVGEIMCEYPNLTPMEAIKLSKKIVKGNRMELFVLDLSFIPWYLLTAVTLGGAMIYVLPYVMTTTALYYENFRLRALADGRVNEDDFLSEKELKAKYMGSDAQNGNYYNPDLGAQNAQQTYYQPQADDSAKSYYYTPPQNESREEPKADYQPDSRSQEYYYTPPKEEVPADDAQPVQEADAEPAVSEAYNNSEDSNINE